MAHDVWEYFDERRRECEAFGLAHRGEPLLCERAGSEGLVGRIDMALDLSPRAWIKIVELVEIRSDRGRQHHAKRLSYGYYLMVDDEERLARDLDSVHGYHGHYGRDHQRIEADRVTFKEFVKLVWTELSDKEIGAEAGASSTEI